MNVYWELLYVTPHRLVLTQLVVMNVSVLLDRHSRTACVKVRLACGYFLEVYYDSSWKFSFGRTIFMRMIDLFILNIMSVLVYMMVSLIQQFIIVLIFSVGMVILFVIMPSS